MLVATVLQELVFDVLQIPGNPPDLCSLVEFLVHLVGRLSGPKLDWDLGDLHVEVKVVHFVHVVLLVVLTVRIIGVKVRLQVVWLCFYWHFLVDTEHELILSLANLADSLILFVCLLMVILDDAVEEAFDQTDLLGFLTATPARVLFVFPDIFLVGIHHDGQENVRKEKEEHNGQR